MGGFRMAGGDLTTTHEVDTLPGMPDELPPHRHLAAWLAAHDVTQAAFAARIGITAEHLSRVVKGRQPGSGLLHRIIALETGVDFWRKTGATSAEKEG
jgi:hypothetical protein